MLNQKLSYQIYHYFYFSITFVTFGLELWLLHFVDNFALMHAGLYCQGLYAQEKSDKNLYVKSNKDSSADLGHITFRKYAWTKIIQLLN